MPGGSLGTRCHTDQQGSSRDQRRDRGHAPVRTDQGCADEAAQTAAARNCKELFQAWKTARHSRVSQFLAALKTAAARRLRDEPPRYNSAIKKAGQPAAQLARYPVPPCADPGGDFAAILTRVRAAAASAGSANSLSTIVQALAPLDEVPALEAEFTAEVKLTAGA